MRQRLKASNKEKRLFNTVDDEGTNTLVAVQRLKFKVNRKVEIAGLFLLSEIFFFFLKFMSTAHNK